MRLFTALDLSAPIQQRLAALISHLRASAAVKWSPAANLHITTKFIGEWPEARLDDLDVVLRSVQSPPVAIEVSGLGWFPNPHRPRVLFVGVKGGQPLAGLASATDRACATLGVAAEKRDYSPHLTLARIQDTVPLQPLREAVSQLPTVDFGSFTPACFHLYRSSLGQAGSLYAKLREYSLREPSAAAL